MLPHGPSREDLVASPGEIPSHAAGGGSARELPVQQVVPIFGISVNLHKLDEKFADVAFLQAVHTPVVIRVGQYQAQGRVDVIADLLLPPGDEALDDETALLMRREFIRPASSLPSACGSRARSLLLVLVQGFEESIRKLPESQGPRVISRPEWISDSRVSC